MVGSDVFDIVESAEKKHLFLHRSNALDDHIFYSRDGFAQGVIRTNTVKAWT